MATAPAWKRPVGVVVTVVRRHTGLFVVLTVAAYIRFTVDRARPPAIYQDSNVYLGLRDDLGSLSPFRPNGYPFLLRVLRSFSDSMDLVTAVQHLAGLGLGVLVYLVLLRLGTRPWLAATGSAIVIFDAYTVALEQSVLTESLFAVVLFGSLTLVLPVGARPPGPGRVGASGALLALAVLMRAVGLFAVPVWLWHLYRLGGGRRMAGAGRRTVAAGVAALLVPLLAYCTFHASQGQGFNLTHADGWFLYAKVAPVVRPPCHGTSPAARPLCTPGPDPDPDYYLYAPTSPAHQIFFGAKGADVEVGVTPKNNAFLRRFALTTIRHRPLAYLDVVATDMGRFFAPGPLPPELNLYGEPDSGIVRYQKAVHTPWWLMAAFLGVAVLVLALRRFRLRSPFERSLGLLTGTAVALMVGTAATAPFNPRYLLPMVPLIVCAGIIALGDLAANYGRRDASDDEIDASADEGGIDGGEAGADTEEGEAETGEVDTSEKSGRRASS